MRLLALAVATLVLVACTPDGPDGADPKPSIEPERPNILLVVTDDMRVDGLQAMPFTVQWLIGGGRVFQNAFATTPLCCPSRASIFTGQYSHNHGVLKNRDSHDLDTEITIQSYLQDAGYKTGIAGKYLNSWSVEEDPPHFDTWASYSGRYFGKPFNINGDAVDTDEYSTYHIGDRARQILREFERSDGTPWFLYLATVAPHTPFTIPSEYRSVDVPVIGRRILDLTDPVVRERNFGDKPDFEGREFALEDPGKVQRKQWRMLLPVDDIMRQVKRALRRLDEERDTLVIFTSDQGLLQGEHGLYAKRLPYTESIQVPMLVRWPGHVEQSVDERLVANVDIAPTLFEVAGVEPAQPTDGVSLLSEDGRSALFIEQLDNWRVGLPDWRSIRTADLQYVEYYDRQGDLMEAEYYDLEADPWQLRNLLGDRDESNDPDITELSKQLDTLSGCEGSGCVIAR
jgi:arylsulfatase A-like enzyme